MLPDSVGDVSKEHGDDGAGEDGQQTDQAACKIEMGAVSRVRMECEDGIQ